MRWVGLGLLLAAGAVVALLQLTGGEADRSRHEGAAALPDEQDAPEARGLRVKDGVAVAPDFEPDEKKGAEDEAATPAHYFFGRAWSESKRRGAEGCTVVLETLVDGDVWGQPATGAAGVFTVIVPAEAIEKGELRVIIESPDGELGVAPAKPEKGESTALGRVRLTGRSELQGRVEDENGSPLAGVRVYARRFGELTLLPGLVAAATTDDVGAFTLRKLPHGSFVVSARGPEGRRFLALPVLVPSDGPLLLRPDGGETLPVTVHDTTYEPVTGARIEAIPQRVNVKREALDPLLYEPREQASTDADGIASLLYLRHGDYKLFLTLPDETTFEFDHRHAPGVQRELRVPADRRLRLKFVEAPAKGPPPQPPVPLKNVEVRVSLKGETSLALRSFSQTTAVWTDDEGVAILPLVGTTKVAINAGAPSELRAGGASVGLPHREGFVNGTVLMRPVEVKQATQKVEQPPERPRRIRITTQGGTPVEGARVYVRSSRKKTTNKAGVADAGLAAAAERGHLFRPDLASGDPTSVEFGGLGQVDLHWNEGREITIKMVDAVDGFPLSHHVKLTPRPAAWRRVAPGVFRTRWDPEYADPEAEIVVVAQDYGPWKIAPPKSAGPPEEYEARMIRPPELTAFLRVEVTARSVLLPGVRVSGRFVGTWKPEIGRTRFIALTGLQGAIDVAGLAEGPWKITADGGATGWKERAFALARGFNPMTIDLAWSGLIQGRVIDDRGRAVPNARIERLTLPRDQRRYRQYPDSVFNHSLEVRWVRTDGKGRFQINLPARRGYELVFRVRPPEHAEIEFRVKQERQKKPLKITVQRLGALDLPVKWALGRSDGPPPDDIEVQVLVPYKDRRGRHRYRPASVTARVVDGRLKAEGVPPGRVRLWQLLGSVWVQPVYVTVRPGTATTSPAVVLQPGGTIEGKLVGGMRSHVFVSGGWTAKTRVVEVGEHGEFRLAGLPPGIYTVRADGQTRDSEYRNRRIKITNSETSHADIGLK